MASHVLIDGNNLLHAMHAHAPVPNVGRETLVRVVERWAHRSDDRVTIVFDGPEPAGNLAKQMASHRVKVVFAAPQTADDVIVEKLARVRLPASVRVVTDDKAIAHEARAHKSGHTGCVAFILELFAPPEDESTPTSRSRSPSPSADKPETVSPDEVERWVEFFEEDMGPLDDREVR